MQTMSIRSSSRHTRRRNGPPVRPHAIFVLLASCLLAHGAQSLATSPPPRQPPSSSSPDNDAAPLGGTPESVVRAQLSALRRNDLYRVFQYASPSNKAATGPWERFAKMVESEPYSPLVGHERAEVLLVRGGRGERDGWRGLVRVWPSPPPTGGIGGDASERKKAAAGATTTTLEYWWFLSRCADRGSPYEGRWLVDGVVPVTT